MDNHRARLARFRPLPLHCRPDSCSTIIRTSAAIVPWSTPVCIEQFRNPVGLEVLLRGVLGRPSHNLVAGS